MSEEIEKKDTAHPSSPKDVFLHLLLIGTLYASVVGFISLWFDYINFLFPDTLDYYYQGILDGVLWAEAVLVVIFPMYIFLSRLLEKEILLNSSLREDWARKWLVYLTLFLAAVTAIVDTVTLVYNFLSGDLSIRFFLKIFIVLVVAVVVFGYYFWDTKRTNESSETPNRVAWAVSVIVLGSIITGFFLVGTPSQQRAARFDIQRVSDLQSIQGEVVNYWQQKGNLPKKPEDLNDSITGFVLPKDPEGGVAYEYTMKEPLIFELCATFKTETKHTDTVPTFPVYLGGLSNQNWDHTKGHVCFSRTLDPERNKSAKPLMLD
jgi:hypothetical protein